MTPKQQRNLLHDFGVLPSIAALVAGVTIYYIYRYWIYDRIIMPAYDYFRNKENHRTFVMRRYGIKCHYWLSTMIANKIIHELSNEQPYIDTMNKRGRPLRAGGIHLLYQSAIFAILFTAIAAVTARFSISIVFISIAAIQGYTAFSMDMAYDDEELIVIKSMTELLDKAAENVGYTPVVTPAKP